MQIAIVGLPGAGKTTVFNALTGSHAETGGYGGLTVNVGVVKVPDARLAALTALCQPRREVAADVTYVDLPAPPRPVDGQGGANDLPADQLARLRNADALLHVVRAFEDPTVPHPEGSVDPWRDLERLDLEFTLADYDVARRRLERLDTSGRHGTPAEREANERERAVLERIVPALAEGRPVRDLGLEPDEAARVRGFRFLTEKPVLAVLDIGEADIPRAEDLVASIRSRYDHRDSLVAALSARIEAEIAELDEDAAAAFRADLGLDESGLERVIRLSYRLLGLISFFTAGPDETRAWTIRDGSTAVDAAGAIHSDLARGFIRAEVVPVDELLALGSTAEARRAGKLRSEGKTYRVRDGDVIEVLFNV
ncbi:MAG TPA: redox-regulated ATPase YchF [Candidatus Limnocylindrales bacterium]|nr:redox-regulated ATPase YchF [Candidatus Limnocylindrales bacterium]